MNLDYKIMFICMLMSFILSFMISFFSFMLSKKIPYKEKVSMYECGFNPIYSPGKPFSMSFFLMAMLFLVFDLEIFFLFPWGVNSNNLNINSQMMMIMFLIIIILGLIYEWKSGGLEWE